MNYLSRLLLVFIFTVGVTGCVTEVVEPPLSAPTLVSPAMDSSTVPLGVQLRWNAVAEAEVYTVQVSEREDFAVITDSLTTGVLVYSPVGLKQNTTYYWHVRALNKQKLSAWSTTRRFSTGAFHNVSGVGSSFTFEIQSDGESDTLTLTLLNRGQHIFGRLNVTIFQIDKGNDSVYLIYEPNGDLTLDNGSWITLPLASKVDVVGGWDTASQGSSYIDLVRNSASYLGTKTFEVNGNSYTVTGALHKREFRYIERSTNTITERIRTDEFWYAPDLGMIVESSNSSSGSTRESTLRMISYTLK